MQSWSFLLVFLVLGLVGCEPEQTPAGSRLVRTVIANPEPIGEDRNAVGEIRPRFESDLSFRVAGKVLSRLVDVGARVKPGETLATLDAQDYENRLRSAEADVSSAAAELANARGTEARQAKLYKDGWTPKSGYDDVVEKLRAAEARLKAAKANLDLARDQLNYTTLKADFDGVVTAIGAEPGQNVSPGQMVVKLAKPDDRDGVFNIAETAFADVNDAHPEVFVWPLSNPKMVVEGVVREISPVADAVTRTYTAKVTLKDPPPQLRFGMTVGGQLKGPKAVAIALPLSALFEKSGSPAVWVLDQQSSTVTLRPVTVARYEANTVIVGSGLDSGDVIVTAGVNTLTDGQKVRVADVNSAGSGGQ